MKYIIRIILLISIVFFSNVINGNAIDNKWSLFFRDNKYEFYYDRKSIHKVEGGLYEVVTKTVLLNGGYTTSLYRIDCAINEYAMGRTVFSENNNEISNLRLTETNQWKWSKPDSHLAGLVDKVCKYK
jgi:hypothetical protein